MIGRTADYALRALLVLAREQQGGRYLHADDVAGATGAPRNYTGKVLNGLARAGFVTSSRGPSGGYRLARPPALISVGAVIDLFDTPVAQQRCLNGIASCNSRRPCAAHSRWVALLNARRAPLDDTTIADLVDHRSAPRPRTSSRRNGTARAQSHSS
ncbi:MAG: Rrf2 family transcriptional regulator [Gemmatimonadetes bacterium]|nr:Rrf2 family transcriptional regulator [Gemmatimonadota bacterium]